MTDRYAHPHGFTDRRGAVVGECIEADIDPVIQRQMAGNAGHETDDFDSLTADAEPNEALAKAPGGRRLVAATRLDQQTGGRQPPEYRGPGVQRRVADLGQNVERAEGNRPAIVAPPRRRHGRIRSWFIAMKAVR